VPPAPPGERPYGPYRQLSTAFCLLSPTSCGRRRGLSSEPTFKSNPPSDSRYTKVSSPGRVVDAV
jgi:hypothetical protein